MIEYIEVEKPRNYVDGTNKTHAAVPGTGVREYGSTRYVAVCGQKQAQETGRKWSDWGFEKCSKCEAKIEKIEQAEAKDMADFRPVEYNTVHMHGKTANGKPDYDFTACGRKVASRNHVSTIVGFDGCVNCICS